MFNVSIRNISILGAYYISMSAGTLPENNQVQWLFVNGEVKGGIYRNYNESGVVDIVSRSIMLYLNMGDTGEILCLFTNM